LHILVLGVANQTTPANVTSFTLLSRAPSGIGLAQSVPSLVWQLPQLFFFCFCDLESWVPEVGQESTLV
jgi:hypothetical protein